MQPRAGGGSRRGVVCAPGAHHGSPVSTTRQRPIQLQRGAATQCLGLPAAGGLLPGRPRSQHEARRLKLAQARHCRRERNLRLEQGPYPTPRPELSLHLTPICAIVAETNQFLMSPSLVQSGNSWVLSMAANTRILKCRCRTTTQRQATFRATPASSPLAGCSIPSGLNRQTETQHPSKVFGIRATTCILPKIAARRHLNIQHVAPYVRSEIVSSPAWRRRPYASIRRGQDHDDEVSGRSARHGLAAGAGVRRRSGKGENASSTLALPPRPWREPFESQPAILNHCQIVEIVGDIRKMRR